MDPNFAIVRKIVCVRSKPATRINKHHLGQSGVSNIGSSISVLCVQAISSHCSQKKKMGTYQDVLCMYCIWQGLSVVVHCRRYHFKREHTPNYFKWMVYVRRLSILITNHSLSVTLCVSISFSFCLDIAPNVLYGAYGRQQLQ